MFLESQKRLASGLSVCIFPEGGVPDNEELLLDSFKDGAFRLAIDHQIPVAPLTFHDNKKRFPFRFFSGNPGIMRVLVHPILPTKGWVLEDKRILRDTTRKIILEELTTPSL